MPPGVITHPKVQVIWKQRSNIGYGRKINFGARNTNGKYLLFLNDDCFLDPGSVEKMKEAMGPNTGMVCNLLRKPDGSIWHAGKSRNPGSRGWGHIDFGSRSCSIHQITEMENCSGCCVLVKREAHYAIDGFDE
jgi:GT2 family glycosyltransferase